MVYVRSRPTREASASRSSRQCIHLSVWRSPRPLPIDVVEQRLRDRGKQGLENFIFLKRRTLVAEHYVGPPQVVVRMGRMGIIGLEANRLLVSRYRFLVAPEVVIRPPQGVVRLSIVGLETNHLLA